MGHSGRDGPGDALEIGIRIVTGVGLLVISPGSLVTKVGSSCTTETFSALNVPGIEAWLCGQDLTGPPACACAMSCSLRELVGLEALLGPLLVESGVARRDPASSCMDMIDKLVL
jgi:hypothetical protein